MRQTILRFSQWLASVLRNPRFFWVITALLVLQAAWIALTARYPQAFDENFHFGLIQLHAKQWLPYFVSQPDNASIYGSISRDPSYLFHYLLSFPYRLLTAAGASQTVTIIALRFTNIAMFAGGLVLYRRLLARLGASRPVSHVVLLFFVLLPIVPLLAAQINYDNLIFLLTPLLALQFVALLRSLNSGIVPLRTLLLFVIVGGSACLVKYAFVPIFASSSIIILAMLIRQRRRLKLMLENRARLVILAVATLLVLFLGIERFGINLVRYHAPVPKCDTVLTVDECQQYAPWARDYLYSNTYPLPSLQGQLVYPFVWFHRMVFETLFSVTSYFDASGIVIYSAYPPLIIANYTAWVIVITSLLLLLMYRRTVLGNRPLSLLLLVAGFYGLVLFQTNFSSYRQTGEAVAIHGRYFVMVYPLLMLAAVMVWRQLLQRYKLLAYAPAIGLLVLVCFLQGGGLAVWSIQSNPAWFWQFSDWAQNANHNLQLFFKHTIYHKY